MNPLLKTFAVATVAIGSLSMPAFADDASTTLYVNLWDAGDNMEMSADHRAIDNAPRYTDSMGVMVSSATVPAGEITFVATNGSADFEHEMLVGKYDASVGLPYDEDTGRVDEGVEGAAIGEVPELEPGASGSLTLHLAAGNYILYCNIAGHYASGMWTLLTVE